MDVGTLGREHPGWQILARRAGGQVTWHARPWEPGCGLEGWDQPGVITVATAEELAGKLAHEAGGAECPLDGRCTGVRAPGSPSPVS